MTPQDQSPQQLAELLSNKAVTDLEVLIQQDGKPKTKQGCHDAIAAQIQQSIPLVELLECFNEAKECNKMWNVPSFDIKLSSLDTKLKQLLEGESKK